MKFILLVLLTILSLSVFPACAEEDAASLPPPDEPEDAASLPPPDEPEDAVSPPALDEPEDAVSPPASDGPEDAVSLPPSDEAMVVVVTIVDTDAGQGFTPNRFTLPAGLLIELRFLNADYRTRNSEASANSHPVSLKGPGLDTGILELEPGDSQTIIFTTQTGTIIFSCTNPACDIHDKLSGIILIID